MIEKKEYVAYNDALEFIKNKIGNLWGIEIGIILGTGLSPIAKSIENKIEINYEDIPNFPISTVDSHDGKLIVGNIGEKRIVCMSGRFHYYEGYDFNELCLPIRVLYLLGVRSLIVTNAAGSVNMAYRPGDLMVIRDHLNFVMASPTRGNYLKEFGNRFFDMSKVYDEEYVKLAELVGKETELNIHEGNYVFTPGPQFETPAEIRFYRMAGGDAVGMSTVPEVITAASLGIRVLGLSLITNMGAGIFNQRVDGNEVDIIADKTSKELMSYVKKIIELM